MLQQLFSLSLRNAWTLTDAMQFSEYAFVHLPGTGDVYDEVRVMHTCMCGKLTCM